MKIQRVFAVIASLSAILAGNSFAGGNMLELTDAVGSTGGQVEVDVLWSDSSPFSQTLQFQVIYDDTVLAFDNCTSFNNGWLNEVCQQLEPGLLAVGAFDGTAPITGAGGDSASHLFTLTFDVIGGPGMTTVDFDPTFNDEDGDADPILTNDGEAVATENSTVSILGASYNSTPFAPGAPIAFGAHSTGETNPSVTLTIDNDGEMGTTLNGMCSLTGANPGAFIVGGTNPFSVPEAGPNDDVTVECDTENLSPDSYNATLSCSHDGDSDPASPVTYALSCVVNAAPAPEYGSMPAPGSTFNFGTFTTADPPADEVLTIENVGNADGLDGACSITTNPNMAYSVNTGANYGPLNQGATAMRTVTCDTSVVGNHDGGVLSCTHNGSITNPATYTLNCEVTPTPEYSSTPAPGNTIDLGDWPQNNTPTDGALVIDNIGEPGSTLSGTCSLTSGTVIQLTGGGGYSDEVGGGSAMVGLSCDTSQAEGNHTDTLSCTDNDPNSADPHMYTVECDILPPDPGMWGSNPPPMGTIDLTPGGPVPEGTDLTDAGVLEVFNDGTPGDEDIDYTCDIVAGDAQITQSPAPAMGTLVAGGASALINYSCDTSADGSFSATVECVWSAPLEGANVEPYTVSCDVRDPFSEVVETPPSGTPQIAEVGPGESVTGDFLFEEVLGEGLDGSLDDCSLVTGTDFQITTSTAYPQVIPSGGPPVLVQVTFTDPGTGDTFTDTLNCTYTDNTDGGEPEQTPVSWPLEVTVVGRNATFLVTKDFDDDNPAGVEVFLECNTGLPLQQQAVIHDPDAADLGPGDFTSVEFVVVDFEPGSMDCDVNETVPAGYSVSYDAEVGDNGVAGSVFEDAEGCHYEEVESADFSCEITNTLEAVDVVVNKQWIDDHPEFQLPTLVDVTVRCNAEIIGGFACGPDDCISGFIDPNNPGVARVFPDWDGSTVCTATEEPEVGVLQDTSDCASIPLAPGQDGECTIVNTRLFAGIPTLSQYGLILMALLMLGFGAVAFRRYA